MGHILTTAELQFRAHPDRQRVESAVGAAGRAFGRERPAGRSARTGGDFRSYG